MKWVIDNKEWIFSGIGIFVLSLIISIYVKKKSSVKQIQKTGAKSTNYQAGGDIKIVTKDD
jgi:uncharacterized membrane protein YczE